MILQKNLVSSMPLRYISRSPPPNILLLPVLTVPFERRHIFILRGFAELAILILENIWDANRDLGAWGH